MCSPLFLSQPSVLIVSYIESVKAATRFGCYQQAEWKPDDSMIAIVVSKVDNFFFNTFQQFAHANHRWRDVGKQNLVNTWEFFL